MNVINHDTMSAILIDEDIKHAEKRSQMAKETALAAPSPSQLGTLDIAGRVVGP